MRLAVFLSPQFALDVAREAENLGFACVLVPEGFRGDAMSVLGAVAAVTDRIELASGVMQIPARTPVMTALGAATLAELSGDRFRLGLGVSNPDVSTGWYGVDFARPLERTREYIDVVRLALSGAPVLYQGRHHRLPPVETGDVAQLRAFRPRPDLPIYLGAVGDKSIDLAAEIADGWIGAFCSPDRIAAVYERIVGRRAGRRFEIIPSVPVGVGPTIEHAASTVRPYFANFLGIGRSDTGIYNRMATDMGFGSGAAEAHRLCSAGDRSAAAAAVPLGLMEKTSLLGTADTMARTIAAYERAGATTLGLTLLDETLDGQIAAMHTAVEAHLIAARSRSAA